MSGCRLRVHRTRDAGETWEELGAGLPDGCWSVVLRDAFIADDADSTGLYLGTRDGSVWASPDEGESPTTVAPSAGGARRVDVDVPGGTVEGLPDALAAVHPLLGRRLRDETGALLRFVNVYVDGEDVRWDGGLAAAVPDGAVVQVLPSVAGG